MAIFPYVMQKTEPPLFKELSSVSPHTAWCSRFLIPSCLFIRLGDDPGRVDEVRIKLQRLATLRDRLIVVARTIVGPSQFSIDNERGRIQLHTSFRLIDGLLDCGWCSWIRRCDD